MREALGAHARFVFTAAVATLRGVIGLVSERSERKWASAFAPASRVVRSVPRMGLLPWLILLIGVPVSILLFGVIRDAVESVARLRFERQAGDAKGIIEGRVHSYAQILYALRALFASQSTVTRAEFRGFVEGLDLRGRYPGFDSVNFARYVTHEHAKRFEEEVRRDTSLEPGGYPHFAIKPPGPRAEYFVVVYIEPMRGYEFAFGHDLASSPGVSEA